jgi:shikimate dehydrogenase
VRYLGVIGYPLKQSLSPAFQQAALDHLRLDILYEPWPTPADGLPTRITGLRAPSVLGANVTIPHKEAALPMMDELDDIARKVGAVNTIVNREGRLHGYNTDVAGFLHALREDAGFDPSGRRALVVGAGGAARAAVVSLSEASAASVTVINRTLPRAERLIEDLRPISSATALSALPDEPSLWAASLERCDLLVNCTSVGSAGSPEEKQSPVPTELLRPDILVYDLIYRPAETPLMTAARQLGCQVMGGLPMLVYQGAASFELWTGREAPLDIMFGAARQALGLTAVREH